MRNQLHYNDVHFDVYQDLLLVRTSTESSESFKWRKQNRRWFRIGWEMKTFSLLKLLSSLISLTKLLLVASFDTYSGVRQGWPISPVSFQLCGGWSHAYCRRQSMTLWELILVMGEWLCDLEHADDVVCLFDTAESAQLILDRLVRAVIPFGVCFAPSKCKVMYQD